MPLDSRREEQEVQGAQSAVSQQAQVPIPGNDGNEAAISRVGTEPSAPAALTAAQRYLQAGLSVLSIRNDASKAPAISAWHRLQTQKASDKEVHDWFRQSPGAGVAIICGRVSRNLVVLDFDAQSAFEKFRAAVEGERPGLLNRLPVIRTPRAAGGRHVYIWRAATASATPCMKLAFDDAGKLLVETKGEGGYVLAPGSPGSCHPTGRTYEHVSGPAIELGPVEAVVSDEQWQCLMGCARALNRSDAVVQAPAKGDVGSGVAVFRAFLRPSIREVPGVPVGRRNDAATSLAGSLLANGASQEHTITELLAWNQKNRPPLEEAEVLGVVASLVRTDMRRHPERHAAHAPERRLEHCWPPPPAPAVFHGLAGAVVRAIAPHSEADQMALLIQILVGFGNLAGRGSYFMTEADRQTANLYAVMVGNTSKGRKGTSWGHSRRVLSFADPRWSENCLQSGLSTGEGMIWTVRDPITKVEPIRDGRRVTGYQDVVSDPGIADKRALFIESEFASVLRLARRDGNTLSSTTRLAWDTGSLRSATKNSPARATGAHISIIGHVTKYELLKEMGCTEAANGLGNRILWVCVARSKSLPEGGQVDEAQLGVLAEQVSEAAALARQGRELRRDHAARELWFRVYPGLSEGRPGMVGAMLGRAEAQVTRLSLIYALLDRSEIIKVEHLQAALAVWEYCENSVHFIFGDALGDPVADDILRGLRENPGGLTRTEIRDMFGRHARAHDLEIALRTLHELRLAGSAREHTGGRPVERWFAAERDAATIATGATKAEVAATGSASVSSVASVAGQLSGLTLSPDHQVVGGATHNRANAVAEEESTTPTEDDMAAAAAWAAALQNQRATEPIEPKSGELA